MVSKIKVLVFVCSILFGYSTYMFAGWARSYGAGAGELADKVAVTSDGGYVVVGATGSFGGGGSDVWILKFDSLGSLQWQKAVGGSGYEEAWDVHQTSDGGYIVACSKISAFPQGDFWVIKFDSSGNIEWQRTYGGAAYDEALSVEQTSDGGYIVLGLTGSYGAGAEDALILKLNSSGTVQWQKVYGGPMNEDVFLIHQTTDGGYIAAGLTDSYGAGGLDWWILKLDSLGAITWQKAFGFSGYDIATDIQQTADGQYIVVGTVTTAGNSHVELLKLDSAGNIQWQKMYLGGGDENASSVQQTSDGGYIVGATTTSFGGGTYDLWVFKSDSTGNIQWEKSFGDALNEHGTVAREMPGGGYIVSGSTMSFGVGEFDDWILRLDSNGEIAAGCPVTGDTAATVSLSTLTSTTTTATSGTVAVNVATTADSATGSVAIELEQCATACTFCDDFEDGILSSNWNYVKPAWSESGGSLIATASKKAIAVASPAFAGCTDCSFEATLSTSGGPGNQISLIGWYTDKGNQVEVILKQESGKIIVKQRSGGSIVAKTKGFTTISPNVLYAVKIAFDGSTFEISVDGNVVTTMPAAATPSGTLSLQAKRTTAHFDQVTVQ